MARIMQEKNFTPFDIWQKGGVTEHIGGVSATRRLLAHLSLTSGQHVLDVGCGTGFTACYLAKNHQVRVEAFDLTPRSIEKARQRITRQDLADQVHLTRADAHHIPYPDDTFDAAILESLLVFCDPDIVTHELYRVLKTGGAIGINELTLLKPPPQSLISLLANQLGIQTGQQGEWEAILRGAGFTNVSSTVAKIRFREQITSHLQADGIKNYLAALWAGMGDARIRSAFFNREMLSAARNFLPYVGYGLYVGKKS